MLSRTPSLIGFLLDCCSVSENLRKSMHNTISRHFSPSPLCEATLLAPDFARLDDYWAPLCTPTLRALGGDHASALLLASPRIASPALAGWTPRLSGIGDDAETDEHDTAGASLRSMGRASLAAVMSAGGALALRPPELPLPALIQTNLLLPMSLPTNSLPTNVRQCTEALSPLQPQAGTASSPQLPQQLLVKVEPGTSAGSGPGSSSELLAGACLPASSGACHRRSVTAAGVADAMAVSSCSTAFEPESAAECIPDMDGEQKLSARIGSGVGGRPGSGSAMADVASAAAEDSPDNRLTLEFLEENGYFDMPIQQAAAELRVGVTTLKKVCRVNNIGRWPFRKRSSLNRLIEKTREYFAADPQQCAEALAQLEAQRSVLQLQQGEDIPQSVKRYRQSIFKLDYKCKKIARERRTHRGAAASALAALDKVQTMRQLSVGTPTDSLLSILCEMDTSCASASVDLEVQHQQHAAEEEEDETLR